MLSLESLWIQFSKSCAVHRKFIASRFSYRPVSVFFLGRLSEDVATRLSACYLISLTEAAHRYLDDLTKRDMLGTRALNLVCIKLGKNGAGGGWVGWVRVLISKLESLTCFLCSSKYPSSLPCFSNQDLPRWNCFEISDFQTDLNSEH